MSNVTETLNQRGSKYGTFEDNADTCQTLKDVIYNHPNIHMLENYHKEALDMIFHKIARIINGQPDYDDSWHDIAGYATLVEQIIIEKRSKS